MVEEQNARTTSRQNWQPRQLAVMCVVCLAMGLVAGYLLRGSAPMPVQAPAARAVATAPAAAPTQAMGDSASQQQAQQIPHKMPTLDDMKRMADKKAAPLLAKLKSNPQNARLLNQVGLIYESTHQFKEAAGYFEKSLHYDPKNIGVRADYASCLYYTGDVDGALAQLDESLAYDPKHAGTLINIGIIRWRGKNDVDGAVAAWEKLLQYHPDFPQKELVQHMITQAKQTKAAKTIEEGQRG
jgi:tetratricopeptide (TPR) repeat protein